MADNLQRAIDLFQQRTGFTREQFNQLSRKAKCKAFTVAYCETVDQINAIHQLLVQALRDGMEWADFYRQARQHLASHPWHLETVLRTNVQSAYGAARWEAAQELRSLRPYARYSAILDGRTRPDHARLHGIIRRIDDQFWQRYWPPWDYNCRCHVQLLTEAEARELGGVTVDLSDLPTVGEFVSPAAQGIEIDPLQLLSRRAMAMPAGAFTAATNRLQSELATIEEDKNALRQTPGED